MTTMILLGRITRVIILLVGIFAVGCSVSRTTGGGFIHQEWGNRKYSNSPIGLRSEYLVDIKFDASDKYLKEISLPQRYKKALLKSRSGKGAILYTGKITVSLDPNIIDSAMYVIAIRTEYDRRSSNKGLLDELPMLIDRSALSCVDNFDSKWYESRNWRRVLFYHHSVRKNKHTAYNVLSHHREWKDTSVISIHFIQRYEDVKKAGYPAKYPVNVYYLSSPTYIDDLFQNVF